jgi:GTPase
MAEETEARTVAGTVAILGRPNVGKSTLLNRIVGEKLAIVTPKPQTTRNRITGVYNHERGQIVFVDTPGVHGAKKGLNRFMVAEAMGVIPDVDAALLVIDVDVAMQVGGGPRGTEGLGNPEAAILRELAAAGRPVALAVNKVDTLKAKTLLLPVLERLNKNQSLRTIVPVSATKGTNVDNLVGELWAMLPTGPPLYGPEMLTDRSERFLAGELIREQLFLTLRQEIPYAVAVVIEEWEEREGKGDVVISATIIVEREGQRAIILGHKGEGIREIGTQARGAISDLLQRPAHLKLHIKVHPDWTTSLDALARYGYAP